MPRRYTKEQKDYIREISPGRYNQEIAEMFNARFGTDVTEDKIKCFKANHKIQSNVSTRRFTGDEGLFNRQQKDFIRMNAAGLTNEELAALVNATFELSVTARQMNTWKKNHNVVSGLDFRFKKGSAPANKGKKGLYNVGGNKTSFKEGHRPNNYMPVGSERVNGDDYVDIKIADPNKWRGKHLLVWEQHSGRPVPNGHAVIFGNGDRRNFDPNNLILVSRAQLAVMNRRGLIQNDADLTRTAVLVADLISTTRGREKG